MCTMAWTKLAILALPCIGTGCRWKVRIPSFVPSRLGHILTRGIGSNEMDGVVGLTQCAIQPSQTFTYRFRIAHHQEGTFW